VLAGMKNAQRLAVITVLTTLVLIGVGVLVRATGSGLGCPDWPLCHGGAVPPNEEKAIIEYSHRFVASLVGLLVIATAVFAWRHYRNAPVVLWAATLAVPLVGLQGLLGAITVVRELPPEVVATHLLTAMIVLTFEIVVAVGMWSEDPDHRERFRSFDTPARRRLAVLSVAALAWLAAVIWVGGYMTESGASTACEGWPLCNGSVTPASDDQEVTHMLHRYLAGAFLFLVIPVAVVAWRARRELPWAAWIAGGIALFYTAQVMVGALNVWLTFPDPLTISHTVIASLVWSTLSTAAAFGYYQLAPERIRAAARRAEATA
jgi:heme A synthase